MPLDALGFGNGLLVRVGLYLLLFWPTVGYYVYHDASARGLSRPELRGVGFGFFGVVGLFAYLATRPDASGH